MVTTMLIIGCAGQPAPCFRPGRLLLRSGALCVTKNLSGAPAPLLENPLNKLTNSFDLPARVLMCIIFIVSGVGKLTQTAYIQAYMAHYGVPVVLVWPAAAFELICGTMLLLGWQTRYVAILLSGWCLLTASIFHTEFSNPTEQIMLMKNLVMAGGFLVLAMHGAPRMSLDARSKQLTPSVASA
jgi:putative oxidoreductase